MLAMDAMCCTGMQQEKILGDVIDVTTGLGATLALSSCDIG